MDSWKWFLLNERRIVFSKRVEWVHEKDLNAIVVISVVEAFKETCNLLYMFEFWDRGSQGI